MGYSRVGSSLLCRACRPQTVSGYSDAGSTCSPSFGVLATAVMFSSIFLGTLNATTPYWVLALLLAVIFAAETGWNVLVARIFSLDRTRARYISLKTVIDRSFGAMLALLGVKIVAT